MNFINKLFGKGKETTSVHNQQQSTNESLFEELNPGANYENARISYLFVYASKTINSNERIHMSDYNGLVQEIEKIKQLVSEDKSINKIKELEGKLPALLQRIMTTDLVNDFERLSNGKYYSSIRGYESLIESIESAKALEVDKTLITDIESQLPELKKKAYLSDLISSFERLEESAEDSIASSKYKTFIGLLEKAPENGVETAIIEDLKDKMKNLSGKVLLKATKSAEKDPSGYYSTYIFGHIETAIEHDVDPKIIAEVKQRLSKLYTTKYPEPSLELTKKQRDTKDLIERFMKTPELHRFQRILDSLKEAKEAQCNPEAIKEFEDQLPDLFKRIS